MNRYFKTLELHKILEMLAEECSNEKTRQMVEALEPVSELHQVKAELQKTDDAFQLSVKFGTPVFLNFKNISASLKRAVSGSSLSLRELLDIEQMLQQVSLLTDWFQQCAGMDNSLSYLFSTLTPNKRLQETISNSILNEEELSDGASPELASIRRKIGQAEVRIRQTLDKMVRSQTVQKSLQESLVTLRDGRFVLPVRADAKSTIQGLIHDTSSSGATLFIEPISVVEANNDIRVLKGREQEEVERIIREMSAECANFSEYLLRDYEVCAELNLYFAKANLAAKMEASVPEVSDDGILLLKNARHPLIDKHKVVPIQLDLGGQYQALIITGPNTGGKTVVLKTAGLLTAMTMCGLMIPVSDGSRVSVFDRILADIGDQQSIEASLSTFSSHMNQIIEILRVADERSLILMDELGSGTDPVEGAALGVSIIENLKSKGARLLVTTHYQELKLYALDNENIENAACEFDVQTLQPTYRLIIGSPGKSNAFAISSRLGVPEDIINHARSLVSTENLRLEEVISQLDAARQRLEQKEEEIASLKIQQETEIQELRRERDRFEQEKEQEREKARQQAMRIVEGVRAQSDQLLDELTEIRRQKEKENFSQMAAGAKSIVRSAMDKMYTEANPVVRRSNEGYVLPRPLKKGDTVLIVDTNKTGVLVSDPDSSGNVFVQSGAMKTKTSLDRLRLSEAPAKNSTPQKKPVRKKSSTSARGVESKLQRRADMELDIRGKTADEGVHEMELFLDNAVMSGMGIVTIIHGKGTGVLRQAIHKALRSHPSVQTYRLGIYGEGEDGVTIVELV